MMDKAVCPAKHAVFQPTDEQWRCPQCSADNDKFWIEESDPAASDDCSKLHEVDSVYCHSCENGWSGKTLAKKWMNKFNRMECPTCKGSGNVKKKEEK